MADDERCHCGREVHTEPDGFTRGLCEHCSAVRCDAFPGECREGTTVEWGLSTQHFPDGPWTTTRCHSKEHVDLLFREEFRDYPAEAVRVVSRRVTAWQPVKP